MFKTAAGYFFFQLSLAGLVINLGVLIPLSRIMKKGDKHCVYLIAIVTILNDIINLLVNCCYFAPTIIASNYILSDSPNSFGPMLMVSIAHFSWYNGNLIMIVMALNRLIFVVFDKTDVFTKQRVIIFFVLIAILSFSKILVDIFVIPCCVIVMDHQLFGFTVPNPENQKNWADLIDTPIQITIFAVTIISYIVIFIKIRMLTAGIDQSTDSKYEQKLRARELSVSVQFASVSIFSMLSYASLKLTPLIFGENCIECNMISPVFFALSCFANGCIYMFMNEEVKDDLLKKIFKHNTVHCTGGPDDPNVVPFEQPELM